jgi:1-acyl-sn-glycerol-3-phosphate acyltransferase
MKIINLIWASFLLALIPVLTTLMCIIVLILVRILRCSQKNVQIFFHYWGRLICILCGVSVHAEGLEKLKANQTYIFAANHQSQFDIFVLHGYLKCDFRWLAKKELFQMPIWGGAMQAAGYIPIDRSHGRRALKSLEEAARQISAGTSVVVFPEGTRSLDGKLQPFKPGGIILAIKSGMPLVPVAIKGTYEILPKGRLLMKPGLISLRIGDPIDTRDFKMKQRHELAKHLETEVLAFLHEKKFLLDEF